MSIEMASSPRKRWSLRRKILMGFVTFLAVLALALGLGLGIPHRYHGDHFTFTTSIPSPTSPSSYPSSYPSSSSSSSSSPTPTGSVSAGIWQPTKGSTWNIELSDSLNPSSSKGAFNIWDIDLFDNDAETISSLQSQGAKVICYFSAGTYEDWRPDAANFSQADLGNEVSGWSGERWLNTASSSVRQIMQQRLDLATQKKCDGVDPDNVDAYSNANGLGLTQANSIDYVQFLANAAQQRGLSIGLKNAGEIISNVIDVMQWSMNEQCVEYNECATFAPFVAQGKPVFHIEYPKGGNTNNDDAVSSDKMNEICGAAGTSGFSTISKNMNLDSWVENCSGTTSW